MTRYKWIIKLFDDVLTFDALKQFLAMMKGKSPISVIADDDIVMKMPKEVSISQYESLHLELKRKVEVDFTSIYSELMLQTHFHNLEQSNAKSYMQEIFHLFCVELHRPCVVKVNNCKNNFSCCIYIMSKCEIRRH
ncbi:hypothetical protein CR513_24565, partial [Mucuna pruriens]